MQNLMRLSCLGKGACVGLFFINRPEWLIVDNACSAYSFISVPVYDTLGMHLVTQISCFKFVDPAFNSLLVYEQALMQLSMS
jgi:hypothetical protein